jgi:hypothetical protein
VIVIVVRFYSSVAPETTLSAGITNASTSITVGSVVGFPPSTPYTLALDYEGLTEELVQVNAAAGTTLTVARAVDGTSAASHNAGARVRHVSSARDFADSRSHENTGNGVHGLAGGEVIVGTTSVQTLTNKTLTAPVLNSPTINSTIAGSPTFTGTWTGDVAAKIRLNNVSDVSLVSVNHAFQSGLDSGSNIRMDNNEIMAVTNGVGTNLILNADGGAVTVNGGLAADNTTAGTGLTVNGTTQSNILSATRTTGLSDAVQARISGDATARLSVLANGALNWGGGVAQDTNLFRSAANTLRTDDNFQVGLNTTLTGTLGVTGTTSLGNATASGTLGVTGTTTLGTANVTDLTVSGTFTSPAVTASGSSIATPAAGFTVAAATQGYKVNGMITVNIVWTRTGAPLVADSLGNLVDTLAFAILAPWRPNAAFGTERISVAFNSGGTTGGTVGLNPSTGQVELLTANNSSTINTSEVGRVTFTYPA